MTREHRSAPTVPRWIRPSARTSPESCRTSSHNRILQEALANVRRHAGAVSATVCVRYASDHVELEVTNPVADCRRAGGHGDGIRWMLDRARMYGGSMHAGFEPGGTFAVRARLPL